MKTIASIIFLFLINSVSLYASESMDAYRLIDKVKSKYKGLSSYHDNGIYESHQLVGNVKNPIIRQSFITHYRNDGKFRLEWHGILRPDRARQSIIWGSVDSSNVYIENIKQEKNRPLKRIMPVGYSGEVQFNIPGLLIEDIRNPFDEKDAQYTLATDYDLYEDNFYVLTKIHARKNKGITKYWINSNTYFIHRYEKTSQFSKNIIEYTNIDINQSLADKQFSFTPSLNAMEEIAKLLRELPLSGSAEKIIILNDFCKASIPDFYEDTQHGYKVWSSINDNKIKLIDDDAAEDATSMLLAIEKKPRAEELDQICKIPRATFEMLDDRRNEFLTAPKETWEYFKVSLKNVDRVGALACLTGSAKEKFRKFLKQATAKRLAALSENIGGFKITLEMGGDMAEGITITKNNKVGTIQFQKINGAWKITDM